MTSKKNKKHNVVIASALMIFFIGILLFSGPISALTMAVATDKSSYSPSEVITLAANITVNNGERVPITGVNLTLTGPGGTTTCLLPSSSTNGVSCAGAYTLNVTAVSGNWTANYDYGYRSATYNSSAYAWGYGYGYGYGTGYTVLSYVIQFATSTAGSYSARIVAVAEDGETFSSTAASFSVTATTTTTTQAATTTSATTTTSTTTTSSTTTTLPRLKVVNVPAVPSTSNAMTLYVLAYETFNTSEALSDSTLSIMAPSESNYTTYAAADGSYTISSPVEGTYTVYASKSGYSDSAVEEIVVRTETQGIGGDVDGDNHVDFNDLTLLAAAYGSSTGDSTYNEYADFNGDGVVDYDDLIVLAYSYEI